MESTGKEIEYHYNFNADGTCEIGMDNTGTKTACTYQLTNGGKYLLIMIEQGEPQTSEIIKLSRNELILKAPNGTIGVLYAEGRHRHSDSQGNQAKTNKSENSQDPIYYQVQPGEGLYPSVVTMM